MGVWVWIVESGRDLAGGACAVGQGMHGTRRNERSLTHTHKQQQRKIAEGNRRIFLEIKCSLIDSSINPNLILKSKQESL